MFMSRILHHICIVLLYMLYILSNTYLYCATKTDYDEKAYRLWDAFPLVPLRQIHDTLHKEYPQNKITTRIAHVSTNKRGSKLCYLFHPGSLCIYEWQNGLKLTHTLDTQAALTLNTHTIFRGMTATATIRYNTDAFMVHLYVSRDNNSPEQSTSYTIPRLFSHAQVEIHSLTCSRNCNTIAWRQNTKRTEDNVKISFLNLIEIKPTHNQATQLEIPQQTPPLHSWSINGRGDRLIARQGEKLLLYLIKGTKSLKAPLHSISPKLCTKEPIAYNDEVSVMVGTRPQESEEQETKSRCVRVQHLTTHAAPTVYDIPYTKPLAQYILSGDGSLCTIFLTMGEATCHHTKPDWYLDDRQRGISLPFFTLLTRLIQQSSRPAFHKIRPELIIHGLEIDTLPWYLKAVIEHRALWLLEDLTTARSHYEAQQRVFLHSQVTAHSYPLDTSGSRRTTGSSISSTSASRTPSSNTRRIAEQRTPLADPLNDHCVIQ
jgi:hypothetical protein